MIKVQEDKIQRRDGKVADRDQQIKALNTTVQAMEQTNLDLVSQVASLEVEASEHDGKLTQLHAQLAEMDTKVQALIARHASRASVVMKSLSDDGSGLDEATEAEDSLRSDERGVAARRSDVGWKVQGAFTSFHVSFRH